MRRILFRRYRSEKEYSDDGGSEMIGAILKAREACGKTAKSLNGTWRCVEGQMMMIPAALCRLVENLHGDMSYVLIGGLMWNIQRR